MNSRRSKRYIGARRRATDGDNWQQKSSRFSFFFAPDERRAPPANQMANATRDDETSEIVFSAPNE